MSITLIDKRMSTGWKGILILLIVLGHCSLLCKYGPGENDFYTWRSWIYTFHVWSFFILPFFYGCKTINQTTSWGNLKRIEKYFIRLYVPYTWITIVCITIAIVLGKELNLFHVIQAWIVGSQWMTSYYIGFHFLWFLPTMFSVLVMRDVYFKLGLCGRLIMLSLLLFFCIYQLFDIKIGIINYFPFNLVAATKYAFVGIISRNIVERTGTNSLKSRVVKINVHLIFIISTLIFFIHESHPKETSFFSCTSLSLSILLPVTFGCFIIWYQKLGNFKLFQIFGKFSLEIYLFHVIVYNILLICAQRFVQSNLVIGMVIYVLTLVVSLGIAILINRNKHIYNILFPKINSKR